MKLKKAAMFGLESRMLKKQFGKLFLVRMQSVDSEETRRARIQSNRAAMFGLDARIALAIFGALSVISGAALYSAIQEAKVTALLTELNELSKSYDAYFLDTSSQLDVVHSNIFLDIQKLVDSTEDGWNGPYNSYPKHTTTFALSHSSYGRVYMTEMLDGNWTSNGAYPAWQTSAACAAGTVGGQCTIWSVFEDVPEDIYNALDTKVDGSINGQSGNVRQVFFSGVTNHTFLKHRAKL